MPATTQFIIFSDVPNLNPTASPTYYYMTDPGKEGLWKYDSTYQSGTANRGHRNYPCHFQFPGSS